MSVPAPLTLSDLTRRIESALSDQFAGQQYWVVAEISAHKLQQAKGFHYFELVEKNTGSSGLKAKVSAVAWTAGARQIAAFERTTGQPFTDGLQVLVNVSVDYNSVYGLKLTLQDIDAGFTIGQLAQQKQATLQRLITEEAGHIRQSGDAFITSNNQLPLPVVLQHIAVVTAQNSAGYQDFHHTLLTNQFGYQFVVDTYFTAVQGADNAPAIKQRMLDIFISGKPYDVVVIIRGGGANTDFLVFDTFLLGQVTARFPIPIITGIGHQHNETIVDLMAHTPLKTPTKAAEFLIAHNKLFEDKLDSLQNRLLVKTQQLLASQTAGLTAVERTVTHEAQSLLHRHQRQLDQLSAALLARPGFYLRSKQASLQELGHQLQNLPKRYFDSKSSTLLQHENLFRVMHPDSILKRGFALLQYEGKIVRKPEELPIGADIEVILATTKLTTTIKAKKDVKTTDL
jgi:exodeoxyribonuclease VII large subunit